MSKKSPFVPSGTWRQAVEDLYRAHFAAAGVEVVEITIHADSSATVNLDELNAQILLAHPETMALGAYTAKRNLKIVISSAMQYLAENDPFASRGTSAPSRKLSEEERAAREAQAELRRKLAEMLNRYKPTDHLDDVGE